MPAVLFWLRLRQRRGAMWLAMVTAMAWLGLQLATWWPPYLLGASERWSQSFYFRAFAESTATLPRWSNHLPPDGLHLVLQVLLDGTVASSIVAVLRKASAPGLSPRDGSKGLPVAAVGGRAAKDVAAARVTTSVPSPIEDPAISVCVPSEMPAATAAGAIETPFITHTPFPIGAAAGGFGPAYCASTSASGLKRSAAAGTRSTSSRRATSIVTFAVMPGFSFSAGFGASMIAA